MRSLDGIKTGITNLQAAAAHNKDPALTAHIAEFLSSISEDGTQLNYIIDGSAGSGGDHKGWRYPVVGVVVAA